MAKATLEKFVERAISAYEQEPGEPEGSARLGMYVRRWLQWVGGTWAVDAMVAAQSDGALAAAFGPTATGLSRQALTDLMAIPAQRKRRRAG